MQKYLCPVCRQPRKATLTDHLSLTSHVQMLLAVGVVAGVVFLMSGMPMALRTLFFYLPLWGVLEFVHGVRVREAAKCPTCHFDPVLYRRDWKAARAKIELKLGGEMQNFLKDFERRRAKNSAPTEAVDSAGSRDGAEAGPTADEIRKSEQSSLF